MQICFVCPSSAGLDARNIAPWLSTHKGICEINILISPKRLQIHWICLAHLVILPYCHIHKITLSSTPDLHSHVHQLWSTFPQLAVRALQTSLYILLHYVPCTYLSHFCTRLTSWFPPQLCSTVDTALALLLLCLCLCPYIYEYNPNSISGYKLDVLST